MPESRIDGSKGSVSQLESFTLPAKKFLAKPSNSFPSSVPRGALSGFWRFESKMNLWREQYGNRYITSYQRNTNENYNETSVGMAVMKKTRDKCWHACGKRQHLGYLLCASPYNIISLPWWSWEITWAIQLPLLPLQNEYGYNFLGSNNSHCLFRSSLCAWFSVTC